MNSTNTIIVSGLMLLLSAAATASTNGEQSFRFLFKAGEVLWIGEDIGGEYEQSILHQIALSGDSATDGQSTLKTFGQWTPIESLKSYLRTETVITLQKRSDRTFGHKKLKWTIQPPVENNAFSEAFDRHVQAGGSNARTFYAQKDAPAREAVTISGGAAEPVFFSERGLFFNYTIDSAYYFPRSDLLLVFTHQPQQAVGMDTMHGFMLLKLNTKDRVH